MIKRLVFLSSRAIIALMFFCGSNLFAQNSAPKGEALEELLGRFSQGLNLVKNQAGANDNDFDTFIRFNQRSIDANKGKLYSDILNGSINNSNIDDYAKNLVNTYTKLYTDFKKIEVEYPSSVAEYRVYHPNIMQTYTCDSACTNPNFANGDLYGWYAAYGNNSSYGHNYYDITGITGAQCIVGQQRAAQDINTGNDYQVEIMHGGNDIIVPTIPRVSPYSSSAYSARIGDSTITGYGVAILQQTFKVTTASENFTYDYAVFLQNPTGHTYYSQPFFTAVVLDSLGDTIPACGKYLVTSGYQTGGKGWDSTTYVGTKLYYRNWTTVYTPLNRYVGQCVTVRFTVADCGQGGHFGYAYVSTSCSPVGLITSSSVLCGQKTITLTGPPGGNAYKWTGPTNGVVGSDSTQVIKIDSQGTYQLIVTPITGNACNDTLSINIPKGGGTPPIPSFKADTACMGSATTFTNTSNPAGGAGIKFYWDFYDQGTYEDSTNANPTWTYITGGVFNVKLHETNNGCGADTVIKVDVDSLVAPSFVFGTACTGQALSFTNTSTGSLKYLWNFGDPSSAPADTTSVANPTHIYSAAGTYTVELIGSAHGPCPSDTARNTITVQAPPANAIITGPDSVCLGSSVTLNISNHIIGDQYVWTPHQFLSCYGCAHPIATPTATTTYTITVNDFICSNDTTFTLKVNTTPTAAITVVPGDTICSGDSTLLKAAGGCSYLWTNNNSTSDSIWVKPTLMTTYSLQATCNGCTSPAVTQQVYVLSKGGQSISLLQDSVCPGSTTKIVAFGGTSYKWLPPLSSTNDTVVVDPTSNFTYSVVILSRCAPPDTLHQLVHVIQPPNACCDDTIIRGSSVALNASGADTYAWTPAATLNCSTCSDPVASPTVTTTYTLVTTDAGGCPMSRTLTIYVDSVPSIKCADFMVPTVFTPNNDGINDDLVINILNATSFNLTIFDRWGKQVFVSTNPTVYWNGRYNGTDNMVPDGTYYYIITASCGSNNYNKKGFVEVLGEK